MKVKTFAKFWDKKGEHLKTKRFKKTDTSFVYNNKTYIINLKATHYDIDLGFNTRRYYFYIVDRLEPIDFTTIGLKNSILTAEEIHTFLNSNELKKLNNFSKKINFNIKNILIGLAIVVGGYLLLTGQLI